MAVQKQLLKGVLAGALALMLSGCVTIPDAIKGSSPMPQQDLVRVMNAPQLYVGQKRVLVAKWWIFRTSRENPVWKLPPFRSIVVRVLCWVKPLAGGYMLM